MYLPTGMLNTGNTTDMTGGSGGGVGGMDEGGWGCDECE